MRSTKALLVLLIVSVCLSGCSMRMGDLTVVSSRNVSLDKVDLDSMPQVGGVTGKDVKFVVLFIPIGFPHLENAIDDALDKGNGDVMIDCVVKTTYWWFLIGQSGIEVKGNVIKTRGVSQ